MDTIKKRVIAFFVGLFIAIFLLEIGLRIAGSIHLKRATFDKRPLSSSRDNHYTILCLGDSFTFGAGASQGKDYPSQLEELLNSRAKKKIVTVINRGRSAQNTAQLLNRLQYDIEAIKPAVIVLLTGEADTWNYWGYQRYLKGKTLLSVLQNHLYRVRVYKLIKLLFRNIRSKMTGNLLDEKAGNGLDRKWFLTSNAEMLKPVFPVSFSIGCGLREEGKYEEAIKRFKEGMKVDSSDGLNYFGIGESYKEQRKYKEAIKWFKEGIKVDPGNGSNYRGLGWVYKDQGKYEEAIEWFKKAIEANPGSSGDYGGIGQIYKEQGKYEEAIKWLKKGMEANPRDMYCCNVLTEVYRSLNMDDEAVEFFGGMAKVNPRLIDFIKMFKKIEDININKEIEQWVESDIEKIIKICRENKIEIILQNYPYGGRGTAGKMLKNIAKNQSIPFVDNHQAFNQLLNKGGKREDYFRPDGHCSDKGYSVMAKNIYDKIMEEKLIVLDDND